tara:strand:+ start:532 stop:1047 length:516 start_codon:yes stop_codon:yes gene_type:complete
MDIARKLGRSEEDLDYLVAKTKQQAESKISDARYEHSMRIKRAIEDRLLAMHDDYIFNYKEYTALYETVMEQASLLHRKWETVDFRNHPGIRDIKQNSIDWFAQPYFKGDTVVLSDVVSEYIQTRDNSDFNHQKSGKYLHQLFNLPMSIPGMPCKHVSPSPEFKRKREEDF